VVHEVLNELVD